jgi:hypothetical protein
MSDLEELTQIKMSVLKDLEPMFPKSIEHIFENDYLVYYIQDSQGNTYPTVDFTKQMPTNKYTYQGMITKSAQDFYKSYHNINSYIN